MNYYMIIWGDNARLSPKCEEKVAPMWAYGLHTPDMEVIDLGSNKKVAWKKYDEILKERKLTSH